MSETWRVLCQFRPSEYAIEVIQAELRPLLPACCRCERISVRTPETEPAHPNNLEWHQDGGGYEGTVRHMVCWANVLPTHVRDAEKNEATVQPFDLVWFNNDVCEHKQPRDTHLVERWFAAIRCSGAIF